MDELANIETVLPTKGSNTAVTSDKQVASTNATGLSPEAGSVSTDILDKQYRLYSWNDTKTQALITTNSVLFAAIGFMYKECLRDTLAMVLLGMATLFLGSSLMICLVQVIPRLSSGRTGAEPNTRSLRGITSFPTWQAYRDALTDATKENIVTDAIRQIYGMASNNTRSIRIIKGGVILTLAGVVMIVSAVFTSAMAARGFHAFGSWQADVSGTPTGANSAPPNPCTSPSTTVGASPGSGRSNIERPPTPAKPKQRETQ